ncbi:MAG: SDR family oxidoreductase, partial [Candidatus Hodarchaeales archaeon]
KPEDVQQVVQKTLQEFEKIDILVNNAGISWSSNIIKMTDEQWDSVIDVNLKGTFMFLRAVAPHMMELKPRGAKIINFTSTAAKFGNPGQANYAASKWGIIALTKVAARELAPYKINVNAIMPGFIETSMTADTPAHYKDQTIAQIPLARTGTPEDVVSTAVFLASSNSDYITGTKNKAELSEKGLGYWITCLKTSYPVLVPLPPFSTLQAALFSMKQLLIVVPWTACSTAASLVLCYTHANSKLKN